MAGRPAGVASAYRPVAAAEAFFRPCRPADVARAAALEAASYPADEAASREALEFRQREAGAAFVVAEKAGAVVGFVCGTQTHAGALTHDSMGTHEAGGHLLCIHSVCVEEKERRRGLGLRLLKAYLVLVGGTLPEVTAVRLICKAHLINFYEQAGFAVVGPSPVVHGADPWTEMAFTPSR